MKSRSILPRGPDSPQAFNSLPREQKFSQLTGDAELLPPVNRDISYYRVGHYYVRVVIGTSPLRVIQVEAFEDGAPYQQMVEELGGNVPLIACQVRGGKGPSRVPRGL